jgi:hypothetical protein
MVLVLMHERDHSARRLGNLLALANPTDTSTRLLCVQFYSKWH